MHRGTEYPEYPDRKAGCVRPEAGRGAGAPPYTVTSLWCNGDRITPNWICSMALNIKNPEVERLASEVAKLARESKTEAIRVALHERASRLKTNRSKLSRDARINAALAGIRKEFPLGDFGRVYTKAEEEALLGFDN